MPQSPVHLRPLLTILRLPLAPACPGVLPPQERRKDLAKMVAKYGEESKVALRNVRKDVMKKIDKVEFSKVRWS